MTHLEIENLTSEYLEGKLEAARRLQVESHLDNCVVCREVIEDIRAAIQACRDAEDLLPPPWLIPKIRRAMLGERPSSWLERFRLVPQGSRQLRLVYGVGTLVFSLSLILNVSGIRLRSLNLQDVNPLTWYQQASSAGHLAYAHAEKFFYDLRTIYEIESRFRNAQAEGGSGRQPGQPKTIPGPSTSTRGMPTFELAYEGSYAQPSGISTAPRSPNP